MREKRKIENTVKNPMAETAGRPLFECLFFWCHSRKRSASGILPERFRTSRSDINLELGQRPQGVIIIKRISGMCSLSVNRRRHGTTKIGTLYFFSSFCNRYFHHYRMFLTVVNKGNSLVRLLNAIDCHTRLAAAVASLQDSDMVESFPVPVVNFERLPILRDARRETESV